MKWLFRAFSAIGGLFLLASAVLIAMGHRPGAGSITTSIDIRAAPERIWPWLHEGERAKKWVSWLAEVRPEGPSSPEVGARETWVMKDADNHDAPMTIEGTCTEYVPPRRLSVRLASAEFSGTQSYVLTPARNGGANLRVTGHYEYTNWFARLLEPLITPAAAKKMKEDLARLKAVVEAEP